MKNKYSEDQLLMISALQHLVFCERQCALIHIEQAWIENRLTAESRLMHAHVDTGNYKENGNVKVELSLPLRSLNLGLTGKADVVEFHYSDSRFKHIQNIIPIEFKHGKPKIDNCDSIQLCAQALCLEEMIGIHIAQGAIFYGKIRRRKPIIFDDTLRKETAHAAIRLHDLFESKQTPKPVYSKKCNNCSLISICMPKTLTINRSVDYYLSQFISNLE